ncbi:MAG: hypothetical protein ABDH49_02380 [Candidatus Hydrothermales bacterium]
MYNLVLLLFILLDKSSVKVHFSKNYLFYNLYVTRETEFEIYNPFYFSLREFLYFKKFKSRVTPYYMRYDWDIGIYKNFQKYYIKLFFAHVCNHGLDIEGKDKRQWNQIGFKFVLEEKNYYLLNSIGYVASPFGPKRIHNNYNWIFSHNFTFKKDYKRFSIIFQLDLTGFFTLKSLLYENNLAIYFQKSDFYLGTGREVKYGLLGKNDEKFVFQNIFLGMLKKIDELYFLYGYFFKNPKHSFFSQALVKYEILKNVKILLDVATISFPRLQRPRFDDFKVGKEIKLKNLKICLYHRERKDDNLFDGKTEKYKKITVSLLPLSLGFSFDRKHYPFYFYAHFKIKKNLYKNRVFNVENSSNITLLIGKKERGFIFEGGPAVHTGESKRLGISYMIKISTENIFYSYGFVENRIFIFMDLFK